MARMLARQAHDEHNPAQFIVTTFHSQAFFLASLEPWMCCTFSILYERQLLKHHQCLYLNSRAPALCSVTLFHLPQIIHEADKIYGVSHSSRISRIDVVTREDALDFVHANLQEHEGNQGDKEHDPN